VGGKIIVSEIYKLINSIRNKEELPEQWNGSIIFMKRAMKQTVVILEARQFVNYVKILSKILLPKLTPYAKEITRIISVDFDAIGQLLII